MGSEADIVVVGAGPAGLVAATVAARAGASVLLLERLGWAGGRLGLQTHPLQGPRSIFQGLNGVEFCQRLLAEAVEAGVEVRLNASVSGIRRAQSKPSFFDLTYTTSDEGPESAIRARSVVLASGSREPWSDFPGSTLPGVVLSGDAQVTMTIEGRLPGKRVLVVGSDNGGLIVAANLAAAGAEVAAIVDESPRILGREENVAPVRQAGIPLLTSRKIIGAQGRGAVEAVTVAMVEPGGAAMAGAEKSFRVDTICLAGPRAPEADLAALAGCPLRSVEAVGGQVPVHNRRMAAPIPGLYVCGDVAGVESGGVSLESGRLAGLWAAGDLGYTHPEAAAQEKLARGRLGYLRRGPRGLLRRKAKAALAAEYGRIQRAPLTLRP